MYPNRTTDIVFKTPMALPGRHKGAYVMTIFFIFILVLGYIGYRTSSLYRAPGISLDEPKEGALLKGATIAIYGKTEPDSHMTINDYAAFSDKNGKFSIELPLQKGYHLLDIRVRNKLGKEARVSRHIVIQ